MKIVSEIIKLKESNIKKHIVEYVNFISKQSIINKNNIFYTSSKKPGDNFLQLFNLYNNSKKLGGIYLLTFNIENIVFLYKEIINNIELPTILKKELINNIRSFENNKKINIFKDMKSISYILIQEKFFNKEDFSEEYLYGEKESINELENITFFFRNVTTLFDRQNYDINEAIFRLKRDFQKELYNFIIKNNINFINDSDINYQNRFIEFLDNFSSDKLLEYIGDYVYYLYFFKKIHHIDIITYINNFLLEFENSIIEDYYVISEHNDIILEFLTTNLVKILKEQIKDNKNFFVKKEYSNNKIKDLFYYHIFY